MIVPRDRLVLNVANLSLVNIKVLRVLCAAGTSLLFSELERILSMPQSVVHFQLIYLMGRGFVRRRRQPRNVVIRPGERGNPRPDSVRCLEGRSRHWFIPVRGAPPVASCLYCGAPNVSLLPSGPIGATPFEYWPVDGLAEILRSVPEGMGSFGRYSVEIGLEILGVVRELIQDEVWPSRLLVSRETGRNQSVVKDWIVRLRKLGLIQDSGLSPCSSPLRMYAAIAPVVRRTRKPKVRRIPPYEPRVHRDHSR